MHNIVIGIPTYKRPELLNKLLLSIFHGNINESLLKTPVHIVVVDNDKEKTAQNTIAKLTEEADDNFRLHYRTDTSKGLANVRNALIQHSLQFKPDYIVFIDDDEYATPNWLNDLVSTIIETKGDFVQGPVIPEFQQGISADISHWFPGNTYDGLNQMDFIATGNLIMSVGFLEKHNLRFDKRFNLTGAEDSYFGIMALKKGAKIYFAKNAITYENIPKERSTLKWLIKRNFSGANTFTSILILEREYLQLFKKVSTSLFYLIFGICTLILIPLPIKFRYIGPLKIAESMGSYAALFNLNYKKYS